MATEETPKFKWQTMTKEELEKSNADAARAQAKLEADYRKERVQREPEVTTFYHRRIVCDTCRGPPIIAWSYVKGEVQKEVNLDALFEKLYDHRGHLVIAVQVEEKTTT